MTPRECYRRIALFEHAEYIPNFEGGVMPRTIAEWHSQGYPADADFARFFGLDTLEDMRYIDYGPIPGVDNQTRWPGVLRPDGKTLFRRDAWGGEHEGVDDGEYAEGAFRVLRPGIRDRADWDRLKRQLGPHPRRYPDHWDEDNWEQKKRRWKGREHLLVLWAPSMVGEVKDIMGFENYCIHLMSDPALVEEIMEARTELALRILGRAIDEVDFDMLFFWEDIAFHNGPILPPDVFERLATPRYKRLADFYRSRGGRIVAVDSDGDINLLIPGWLKGGINHIWPLEAFSGVDVVALRRQYGQAFSMRGGIDKFVVTRGRDAIDRELDRVCPVVQDGGYIPHLDHQIDNVPFDDYCYYMEKKKQMLGHR
jgi:hypothetical protein